MLASGARRRPHLVFTRASPRRSALASTSSRRRPTSNQVPPPEARCDRRSSIGYDRRADEANSTPSRSDTIMLLRTDPKHELDLDALVPARPRSSTIHCPRPDAVARDDQRRLRATAARRGTLQTVKTLTGLPINYLVTVNFHGFKEIVEHARRRLDRRRPPLLQRQRRPRTRRHLRDDQPPPGYQRLTGGRARLRALPPHRLRPLPRAASSSSCAR